jgi:DNA-binding NtrC family response regulator
MMPFLSQPIFWCNATDPESIAVSAPATLVLTDVDRFGRERQQSVLNLLEHTPADLHVVSTTSSSLFSRVAVGVFSDALYYRLNALQVELGALKSEKIDPLA